MEEYTRPTDNEETNPKSKKRLLENSFFTSWLLRRNGETEKKLEDSDDEDEEDYETEVEADDKKEKRSRRPERLRSRLSNIFKRIVSVDRLKPEDKSSRLETKPEVINSSSELAYEFIDAQNPMAYEAIPADDEDDYEGLLLVSEEAKNRAIDEDPNVKTPDVMTTENEGGELDSTSSVRSAIKSVEYVHSATTMPVGEIIKNRREKHLEREVRKVKKEAKTAQVEREEIIAGQREFSKKLTEQARLEARLNQIRRVKNPAEGTPELVVLHTSEAKPPQIKTELGSTVEAPAQIARPEIHHERLKEFVANESEARPELILHKVEEAAERNIPIENIYETRHEIKDDKNKTIPAGQGVIYKNLKKQINNLTKLQPNFNRQIANLSKLQKGQINQAKANPGSDLYKRAIKSGFWTAIAICIVIFFALWIG